MRYRRRLRSRIVISFALFGLGLTALFAAATIYMRLRLEDQLINTTLSREVKNFVDFKRDKEGVPAVVAAIEYDPNRSARIALLNYADGEKRYIIHTFPKRMFSILKHDKLF